MLTTPILFLATANSAVTKPFFTEKLGLRFLSEDDFALVFALPAEAGVSKATELRIQKVEIVSAEPYTVLGWNVENISESVAGLTEKGVDFDLYDGLGQDDLGIWKSPSGAKIAWFKDPDNNTLSLTEYGSP